MRDEFALPADDDPEPIEVQAAQRRILAAVTPRPVVDVPLASAWKRTLAEEIVADRDVPDYVSSAMDGYAVVLDDIERMQSLRVTGDALAGGAHGSVAVGEAVRVMTGGIVPAGADAVVPVEWTDGGSERVRIDRLPAKGANIRPAGEDIRRGTRMFAPGHRIDAASLGILGSIGWLSVRVHATPVVSIISTGDELVEPGEKGGAGSVVNSNAWTLEALVREYGFEVMPRRPIVRDDDREAGIAALEDALSRSDVVITTGGVSVGVRDWVRDAVDALGARRLFWRVSMKPGKPILAATRNSALIVGLPGNPVSAMVGFHLFVAPALKRMAGMVDVLPPVVRCALSAPIAPPRGRREFVRVTVREVDGELIAAPNQRRGSGMLSSMIGANGLADIPADSTNTGAGSTIDVVLIGPIVRGGGRE